MVGRATLGRTHLHDAGLSTHCCPQYPPRRRPGTGGVRVTGGSLGTAPSWAGMYFWPLPLALLPPLSPPGPSGDSAFRKTGEKVEIAGSSGEAEGLGGWIGALRVTVAKSDLEFGAKLGLGRYLVLGVYLGCEE